MAFDAVPETLRRTSLGRLGPGDEVNLEPALRAGEPLGGHYVQGHVDAVGRVRVVEREGDGAALLGRRAARGAAALRREGLDRRGRRLADRRGARRRGLRRRADPAHARGDDAGPSGPGDEVNLEADVLAKYVERLLADPCDLSRSTGSRSGIRSRGRRARTSSGSPRAASRVASQGASGARIALGAARRHVHAGPERGDRDGGRRNGARAAHRVRQTGRRAVRTGGRAPSRHATDDERYAWLDGALGAVAGEVRGGREIVLDVAEVVWEPLGVTI